MLDGDRYALMTLGPPTSIGRVNNSRGQEKSMEIPKATVKWNDQDIDRVFTVGRLTAIEEATGQSIIEVAQELGAFGAKPDATPEQIAERTKKLRVAVIQKFVAACLDVEPDTLNGLRGDELIKLFTELAPPFMEAVGQVFGAKAEPEAEAVPG